MTDTTSVESPLATALETLLSDAGFVDLSPTLETSMHGWQEHPDVTVVHDARNHDRHGYYLQLLVMPEHTGSHVDAPAHVLKDHMDRTIDTFPVNNLLRPGKLVDVSSLDLGPGEYLELADFLRLAAEQGVTINRGDIALIRFDWDHYLTDPEYNQPSAWSWWGGNAPGFTEELCRHLSEAGVRAVGTDTSACDAAVKDGKILSAYGHDTWFLPKDILILEGLCNLGELPPAFFFAALPLRIHQGSGSPIRAVAIIDSPEVAK